MKKILCLSIILLSLITNAFNIQSQCTVSVYPYGLSFPSSGGPGTLNVTIENNCGWGIQSNYSWLSFSPQGYYASSTITVTCAPNNTPSGRTATIVLYSQINSITLTITQDAPPPPGAPTTPTAVNNCGNSIITRVNHPTGETWYWQTSNSGQDMNDSSKTKTVTVSGTYYLRARGINSGLWSTSSASATASVKTVPTVNISASPGLEINYGQAVSLTASGAFTYLWSPGGSTANTLNITPTSTITYTVNGTATNGCSITKSICPYVMNVSISYTKPVLTANGQYGQAPYTYLWNNGTTNQNLTLDKNGTYNVKVTDALGHFRTTSYTVDDFGDFDQNYIKITEPQIAGTTLAPEADCMIASQYFDGLGRPKQNIAVGASPLGKDIVQIFEYDQFGRDSVKYMPFATDNNGGCIKLIYAKSKYNNFYQTQFPNEGQKFTSITDFEASPLNRPLSQSGPGLAWQGHGIGFGYSTNDATVKRWSVNGNTADTSAFAAISNYLPGTLYVNSVTDENGNTSKEYKDLQGQVVMKEAPGGLKTYYIYDDFGLLCCVVPPLATGPENDKLCYYYRYDDRNHMVEKKIPGADPVYMIYDKRDRLVLSQDGNMRAENKWMITIYDDINRPKTTGIYTSPTSVESLRTSINANLNYLKDSTIYKLSETYYDNYNELLDDEYDYMPINGYQESENTAVIGLICFTKTRVLELGEEQWLTTVNYYDNKYRVIQTVADNHLGGKDIISNKYDFVGKITETKQEHTVNSVTTTIVKQFVYDRTGRLLETKMNVNNTGAKTISKNEYSELGQLSRKKVFNQAGTDTLYKTIYAYNIRGWMTKMDNQDKNNQLLFKLDLNYNTNDVTALNQYNGNISKMTWTSPKYGINYYNFKYDNLNRLEYANYNGQDNGKYSTSYDYDFNGNIQHLNRRGKIGENTYDAIDHLTYYYNGNQLIGVNDLPGGNYGQNGFKDENTTHTPDISNPESIEYEYDKNGNLTKDVNKDITDIDYNQLNLPEQVSISEKGRIEYLYDAAGIKLRQKVFPTGASLNETNYIGNFIYLGEDSLKFILADEGRLIPKGNSFDYEYFIKDHLGNNRVTIKDSLGYAAVQQEDHYYPFGMVLNGQSFKSPSENTKNDYLYNGKEFQDELGLDWYDYGARFYDAQLGRFFTIDRFAEKYKRWSPYSYCKNNPLKFIDLNGDSISLGNLYSKENIEKHPLKVLAFEFFASTKAGKKFLLSHAQKGFSLKGHFIKELNITAEKEGALSQKGIDVSYNIASSSYCSPSINKDNDRLTLNIGISSEPSTGDTPKEMMLKDVDDYSHEDLLHGDLQGQRYLAGERDPEKIKGPDHSNEYLIKSQYNEQGQQLLNSVQDMLPSSKNYSLKYIYSNIMLIGLGRYRDESITE